MVSSGSRQHASDPSSARERKKGCAAHEGLEGGDERVLGVVGCREVTRALRKEGSTSFCLGTQTGFHLSSTAHNLCDEPMRVCTITRKAFFQTVFAACSDPAPARALRDGYSLLPRRSKIRKRTAFPRLAPPPQLAGLYHPETPPKARKGTVPGLSLASGAEAWPPEPDPARLNPLAALRVGPAAGAMVSSFSGRRERRRPRFGPGFWPEPGLVLRPALGAEPGERGDCADPVVPAPLSGAVARALRARCWLRAPGTKGSGGDQPAAAAGE